MKNILYSSNLPRFLYCTAIQERDLFKCVSNKHFYAVSHRRLNHFPVSPTSHPIARHGIFLQFSSPSWPFFKNNDNPVHFCNISPLSVSMYYHNIYYLMKYTNCPTKWYPSFSFVEAEPERLRSRYSKKCAGSWVFPCLFGGSTRHLQPGFQTC